MLEITYRQRSLEYLSKLSTYLSSYTSNGRRTTTPNTPKHSWSGSSSSNQGKLNGEPAENLLLAPPNLLLPRGQQSELTSYLSRRRNTTGSISLNKIVDLKNTTSGNTLRLSSPFSSSNSKLSTESRRIFNWQVEIRFLFFEDIFQLVEESDLIAIKQILQANESLVNS